MIDDMMNNMHGDHDDHYYDDMDFDMADYCPPDAPELMCLVWAECPDESDSSCFPDQ
jgi:hypothetical protein